MKIVQHSPHTGFPEKDVLIDIKGVQIPNGTELLVILEDGTQQVFKPESYNLYTIQK